MEEEQVWCREGGVVGSGEGGGEKSGILDFKTNIKPVHNTASRQAGVESNGFPVASAHRYGFITKRLLCSAFLMQDLTDIQVLLGQFEPTLTILIIREIHALSMFLRQEAKTVI